MKKEITNRSFSLVIKILLLLILVLYFTYFLYGQQLIEDLYFDKAPSILTSFVELLYPRFEFEKHRLSVDFFIEKANQVFIRSFFILTIVSVLYFVDRKKSVFFEFFNGKSSIFQIDILRVIFYLSMLLYTADWYTYLNDYNQVTKFYEPIFLYKVFHINYPNKIIIQIIWVVYLMSLLLVIGNIKSVFNSIVVLVLFTLIQGYFYSFGKINHAYATFGYVAFIMPFLLSDYQYCKLKKESQPRNWALKLIQVSIVISYLFAGLEKVFISNFSWIESNTLRSYLVFYQDKAVLNFTDFSHMIDFLPFMVIIFQLGFILILFYPFMKWFFLPAGIIFHIGIYLFTGIGAIIHPWYILYIYFIDWYKIKNLINKHLPGSMMK